MSLENELIDSIYSVLSADSTLTASTGINPATAAARAVTVYKNVAPANASLPFVRPDLIRSESIDDEPFDFSQPPAEKCEIWIKVCSDWPAECRNIAARLKTLYKNRSVTTTNFFGSSWHLDTAYGSENQTDPDRIIYMANVMIEFRMEPV